MGGFSGSVPEPTLARVKELVSSGQLRFFLLSGSGGAAGGGGTTAQTIASRVQNACRTVPSVDYGSSAETLYVCGSSS